MKFKYDLNGPIKQLYIESYIFYNNYSIAPFPPLTHNGLLGSKSNHRFVYLEENINIITNYFHYFTRRSVVKRKVWDSRNDH